MNFASEAYRPDDSKMFMRDDQQFVLPPWAIDRNTAKCAFCEKMHKAGRPEEGEGKLACSSCGGILLIAEEVATATSDIPWTTEDLDLAKEVMKANRDIHDLQTQASVKAETKEPKGKRQESFIHQCFGHDQGAIEGFKDCEDKLQQALDREMAERNAATECEGAVKIEKAVDAQKGDDGNRLEEKIKPDSQKADNEDEDHFGRPEFSEMDAELRKRAKEVYQKPEATIKVIPLSLPERGEMVVEAAVNNDDGPDSYLAAHDTTGIYKDKGVDHGVKRAGSSIRLIHAVGPALKAVGMDLPVDYPRDGSFRWMVVDDCWELPNASLACGPLKKDFFKGIKGKSKMGLWEAASRVLNKALRHGNNHNISYQRGGWVDCRSALAAVREELCKQFEIKVVVRIATDHWLFGLMFDSDPTLKSRYQLAGVVDNNGTLVAICYVRCKSGHNEKVASLIPGDTTYTKITPKHLD